jgi:hypothetical protein
MAMADAAPTIEAPPDPEISIVRLHGEACFWCGAALGEMVPAGTVTTPVPGGVRVWSVVACVQHRSRSVS